MRIEIRVKNVKCGGCVKTIQDGLGEIAGVTSVEVDIPTGMVTVEAETDIRSETEAKLAALGYPVHR